MVQRDDLFERMCRVISLTEKRGHRQVEILLRHPIVASDKTARRYGVLPRNMKPLLWLLFTAAA